MPVQSRNTNSQSPNNSEESGLTDTPLSQAPKPPSYDSALKMPAQVPFGVSLADGPLPAHAPPSYQDAMTRGEDEPGSGMGAGPDQEPTVKFVEEMGQESTSGSAPQSKKAGAAPMGEAPRGTLGKARGLLAARKATKLAKTKKKKQHQATESLRAGVQKIKEIATTESGMATGIDAAANLLDGAGLLEDFVGVCGGAGSAGGISGASTILGVIQGAKAIGDRVELGKEVTDIKARLADTKTLEIVGEFTGHGELIRAVNRSQMIDQFLVSVFESSETEKELDALQAGINTAAGIASLSGTITGGSGAAVGSALGIFNLAVTGGRMIYEEVQVNEARKERLLVDAQLETKFFHRWAEKAEVSLTDWIGNTYEEPEIETQRFTESLWYKDDLAKLVLDRIRSRPYDPNNQRVLSLCGEKPDCLTPENFDKLSEERQAALLYSIQSTLSGEDKLFDGKKKNLGLAFDVAKADAELTFTRMRADLAGFEGSDELLPFWCIYPKAGPLYKCAEDMVGVDADVVVKELFERALDEGPNTQKELHDLLHFPYWDKLNTTFEGRMEARVKLLVQICDLAGHHPDSYLKAQIEDVKRSTDKIFMAECYNYQNITDLTADLRKQAVQKGLDADRLTTNIFNRAIAEGPASVNELNELLSFDSSLFNNETSGSTEMDRINARIMMLEKVAYQLETRSIVSAGSAAADVNRITDKHELATSFGKIRNIYPLTSALQELATQKGIDPDRITTDLYVKIVHEGDESIEDFREFLGFDSSWWNNETLGSTEEDRLEARFDLLCALADYVERNPLSYVRNGMKDVSLTNDKAFIAQSKGFKNITLFADKLHALAESQGLDADRLTTAIFERTISEGPESVRELHELLEFENTSGSTEDDRLKASLMLLEDLATQLATRDIVSVRSVAADITRVTDKVKIAQSFDKLRNIHPLSFQLKELAKTKGMDSDRVTTDLFIRIVDDGDEAIARLGEFLSFDFPWGRPSGSAEAKLDASLKMMNALARYLDRNPHCKMTTAMENTERAFDKHFVAQSYNYANISSHTAELHALASEKGLDADALTVRLFDKALDEGPESVRVLNDLLSFDRGLFYDETRGSTFEDRMEVRLNLLQKVKESLNGSTYNSVQSSVHDVERINDKAELARLFSDIRTYAPLPTGLRLHAEAKGVDFDGMTSGLYRQLVEEGDDAIEAFRRLMTFNRHCWNDETEGTTQEGRFEAQLTMLQELVNYVNENPNTRLKWAIDQTMLGYNKVFLAQSHGYANITPLAADLHNLAVEKGMDADRLTTAIFERCVEEGPDSVEALHELLEFQKTPFNDETAGSTAEDRKMVRLNLLEAVAEDLDNGYIVSVLSASLDVSRITDKAALAKRYAKIRQIDLTYHLTSDLRALAEVEGVNPDSVTSDLYRVLFEEGDEGIEALDEFLSFDHGIFDFSCSNTSSEAKLNARLQLLGALSGFHKEHPLSSLKSGMQQVAIGLDKHFIARSFEYRNITNLTAELISRAKLTGFDPEKLVVGVFDRAIEEGPDSVKALSELLEFEQFLFVNETRGSSRADRLNTRLHLLNEVVYSLENQYIVSVQSAALDVARVCNKQRIAQTYAKLRDKHPLTDELRACAEERGLDPDRITTNLFERVVYEGDRAKKAYYDFLAFDSNFWNDQTNGSTAAARIETRVELLTALADFVEEHPLTRMETAISQVLITHDKVFMAQSKEFRNITEDAEALREMAIERGLNAERLTTHIFERAVDEGPESVLALKELLTFNSGYISSEIAGCTREDLLRTQLILLNRVANDLDNRYIVSVRSAAYDVNRVADKQFVAQSFQKLRGIYPTKEIHALWDLAESQGIDPDRVTTGLFERIVADKNRDRTINALREFLTFEDSWFNDTTAGTTAAGRLLGQLELLKGLADYGDRYPFSSVEQGIKDVEKSVDKVFIAQSFEYMNITPYAETLHTLAAASGRDADKLTTELFREAVAEGPKTVSKLKELLEFDNDLFRHEQCGSTLADRHETRLILLENILSERGMHREMYESRGYKIGEDLSPISIGAAVSGIKNVTDKVKIATDFGKVRRLCPIAAELKSCAVDRGLDPERMTTPLFKAIVNEGAQCIEAFDEFLHFSANPFCDETQASTEEGRLHARVTLMNALADYVESNPHGYLKTAMANVALNLDKVFLAQSYQYANITAKAGLLFSLAEKKGMTPRRVTTDLFDEAITDGPAGIEAFRELLSYSGNPLNLQTIGSTKAGRLEARLALLTQVADYLPTMRFHSVQSAAEDILRLADKVALARSFNKVKHAELEPVLPKMVGPMATAEPAPPPPPTELDLVEESMARSIDQVFDFAEKKQLTTKSKPNVIAGIIRGKSDFKPVFGEGDSDVAKFFHGTGNGVVSAVAAGATSALHRRWNIDKKVTITEGVVAGFTVGAQKIREDDLSSDDPKKIAINNLRNQFPNALPIWMVGDVGQAFGISFNEEQPLGGSGVTVRFGVQASQSAAIKTTRLMFLDSKLEGMVDGARQLGRLRLLPTSGENVNEMEIGAKFEISGKAKLRLDAGIGLGSSVPALNNYVTGKIGISKNSYATLSGEIAMSVEKVTADRAQVKFAKSKMASAGMELKAGIDLGINKFAIGDCFADFSKHILDGGDAASFVDNGNDTRKKVCGSFPDYLAQIAGNLAEGSAGKVNDLVDEYTTMAFQAAKGVEVSSDFSTNFDFNLGSDELVTIPRGDMVPKELRTGLGGEPITLRVGDLAQYAYDRTVRGDLRLAQQLSMIRGSGVRINEETTTDTRKDTELVHFKAPFMEFLDKRTVSQSVVDRFTPELGRTRTALNSFNHEFKSLFGDASTGSGEVKVHSPDGDFRSEGFVGSDKNLSVDFVVENHVDKRTNFEEMENYMGVLNALTRGRLRSRCQETLLTGQYHDGDLSNDNNPITKLFEQADEYGRTTVHLHVWLGERGIRRMLSTDLSPDQLYQAIGEAFRDINRYGDGVLPTWAKPDADRRLPSTAFALPFSLNKPEGYGAEDDVSDLRIATDLVENLMGLRDQMKWAKTPQDEEEVSLKIRDFLNNIKDKVPAYAALAMLVPEEDRAVEMRLTSLKNNKTPIRFAYIQDGRSPEILRCTGFASAAMTQFKRFGSMLDYESRLRIQSLLKEVNGTLNAPSPDMYCLDRAVIALEEEMALMDKVALTHLDLCEKDIAMALGFLETLPDVGAIAAVLPNNQGVHLATLIRNATDELGKEKPNFTYLKSTFKALLMNTAAYRELAGSYELVENTGRLANNLVETEPELTAVARAALLKYREALSEIVGKESPDLSALKVAIEGVSSVNSELVSAAYDEFEFRSKVAESGGEESEASGSALITDLAAERRKKAEAYRSLIGSPEVAAVSYFERTGAVPKNAIVQPTISLGDGTVTASQVRDSELAMASTKPKGQLGIPRLPAAKTEQLARLIGKKNFKKFILVASEAKYIPTPPYGMPKVALVEALLVMLSSKERASLLEELPESRATQIKSILVEFEQDSRLGKPHKVRREVLNQSSRSTQDLKFLREIAINNPAVFEEALTYMGYGTVVDDWVGKSTARLEDALSLVTGDDITALVGVSSKASLKAEERVRLGKLCELIKSSDLRPQTRAKLCGELVDNTFFFEQDELLCEALVSGMNAGDLRIFFDQLYKDGKIDHFLSAGSQWQSLARVGTFMVAWLFTYDNKKALTAISKYGFNEDAIKKGYNVESPFSKRLEADAQAILLHSVVEPLPVDPVVKRGIIAIQSVIGSVKLTDFKDLKDSTITTIKNVGKAIGMEIGSRLVDVAMNGGTTGEIVDEFKNFMKGLGPDSLQDAAGEGGATEGEVLTGSWEVISDILVQGAYNGLRAEEKRSKWITPEVLTAVGAA